MRSHVPLNRFLPLRAAALALIIAALAAFALPGPPSLVHAALNASLPPAAPAAPTLTPGNIRLLVSWTAPADNGSNITDYDVQYSSDGGSTWTEWNASNTSTATNTTITGLTNGTSYQVQVRAANTHGDGPWSPSATMKPGTPVAPAAPLLTSGNAQLSVSWTAPANSGSAITDYDVQYKATSASNWSSHAFTGAGTSSTITTLTNGTEYEVQVRASNGRGSGPWSPSATLKAGLPAVPGKPTVTTGNATLVVTWTAPADNGSPITDYDVEYRTYSRAKLGDWMQWKPNETSISTTTTITGPGINNGTDYQVQVRAGNDAGDGQWSPPSDEVTTGRPDPPAAPTLTPARKTWRCPGRPPPTTAPPSSTTTCATRPPARTTGRIWTPIEQRPQPCRLASRIHLTNPPATPLTWAS